MDSKVSRYSSDGLFNLELFETEFVNKKVNDMAGLKYALKQIYRNYLKN